MMRLGQWVLIGFFLAFLYTGAAFMIVYGRPGGIAETENRALAAAPKWSAESLWSGGYFRGWENYAADHVAFRDRLVAASKTIDGWHGVTGKHDAIIMATEADNQAETAKAAPPQETPPVFVAQTHEPSPAVTPPPAAKQQQGPTGRVIGKVLIAGNRAISLYTYVPAAAEAYADTLNRFQSDLAARFGGRIRASVLLAPTAAEFVDDAKLKSLSDSQQEGITAVYGRLKPAIRQVDALTVLRGHADEPLYFRTDHHWTATGAYYAYEAFMNAQGAAPVPLAAYRTEKVEGFRGSLYAATLSKKLEADTIVLYKPFVTHRYVVHYAGPLKMNVLDMSHAGKSNKYRIFLSGDRPWGQISTDADGDRRIAVVKDSYGNAFVPFLLPHYKEIFVIDPRQFERPLADFIDEHKIDEVLFLNNIEVTMYTGFTELLRKTTATGTANEASR